MRAELAPAIDPGTHRGAIEAILACGDGGFFWTVGGDDRVRVWRPGQSPAESTIVARPSASAGRPDGRIQAAALHPTGATLMVAVDDRSDDGADWSSLLWTCESGVVTATHYWPEPIRAAAYDPGGKWLVVASEGRLRALPADGLATDGEACWVPEEAASVELTDDPSAVAVGCRDGVPRVFVASASAGVLAYDLVDGSLVVAPWQMPVVFGVDRLAVGPDRLALSSRLGPAHICDLDGGDLRLIPDAGAGWAAGLAFNDDGGRLVVGSRRPSMSVVTVHETSDLEMIGYRVYDGPAVAVDFLDRATVVSAGGSGQEIEEWAAWTDDGPTVNDATIRGLGRSVTGVGIGGSRLGLGHRVVGGPDDLDSVEAVDLAPLTLAFDLGTFELDLVGAEVDHPDSDESPADGSQAGESDADGTADGRPPRLALERRRESREVVDGPASYLEYLSASSPEPSEPAAIGAASGEAADRDVGVYGGTEPEPHAALGAGAIELVLEPGRRRMTGHGRYPTSEPTAWTLVGDDLVAVAERDGHLRLLRVGPEGELSGRLLALGATVFDLATDGRWLVAGGEDQLVRLWAIDQLDGLDGDPDDPAGIVAPPLKLFVGTDSEWVIWSESGYYAASILGDRHLVFHVDRGVTEVPEAFTSDRFAQQFYRPAVIRAILETGDERRALADLDVATVDLAENLPPVIEGVEIEEDGDAALIRFAVDDADRPPTTKVGIVQAGLPIWEEVLGGDGADGPKRWEVWVWLDPGPNRFRIVAESQAARSTPHDVTLIGPDEEPGDGVGESGAPGEEPGPGFVVPGFTGAEVVIGNDFGGDVSDTPTAGDLGDEPVVSAAMSATPPPATAHGGAVRFQVVAEGRPATELVASNNGEELFRATVDGPEWVELDIELPTTAGANDLRIDAIVDGEAWTAARAQIELDGGWSASDPIDGRGADAGGSGPIGSPEGGARPDDDDDVPPPLVPLDSSRGQAAAPPGPRAPLESNRASSAMSAPRAGGPPSPPRPPRPAEVEPHLFLVSIGVSDVANDQGSLRDLRYAADDALEVASRFSAARSDAFANVWRRVLTDGAATKVAIEAALTELDAAVKARAEDKLNRNVRAKDVVVFFFAGHGITEPGATSGSDRFYMVAHDHDDDRVAETGVDFERIGRTLSSLAAEVIVLVDACHSGAALPGVYQPSKPGELAKQLQLLDDRTLYIMSATTSDELAWEHELLVPYWRTGRPRTRVGHGFFTHAILKEIDESDRSDGTLSLFTLLGAIQDQLTAWTNRDGWRHVKQRPKARIEGDDIPRLEIYKRRRSVS